MEASEKGLIPEKIGWGDFEAIKALINDIAYSRGLGAVLAKASGSQPQPSAKAQAIGRCMLKA